MFSHEFPDMFVGKMLRNEKEKHLVTLFLKEGIEVKRRGLYVVQECSE
jgi:hypothetical protein